MYDRTTVIATEVLSADADYVRVVEASGIATYSARHYRVVTAWGEVLS